MSTDEYQTINKLAHQRCTEAKICGATKALKVRRGLTARSRFSLSGLDDGMDLIHTCYAGSSKCSTSLYGYGATHPPYMLFAQDGKILVEYNGPDTSPRPSTDDILRQLQTMSIGLPVRVPYGLVKGDLVVALLYTPDLYTTKIGDVEYVLPSLGGLVLESYSWPDELRMERTDEGVARWFDAFWRLYKSGQIVRLTKRIKNASHESYSRGDAVSPGWFDFSRIADEAVPKFGTDPYYLWHPGYPEARTVAEYIKVYGAVPTDARSYVYELQDWFE